MILFEHLMLYHSYCSPSSLAISTYGHAWIIEEYTVFSQTSLTMSQNYFTLCRLQFAPYNLRPLLFYQFVIHTRLTATALEDI